jgi:hypothetical protein
MQLNTCDYMPRKLPQLLKSLYGLVSCIKIEAIFYLNKSGISSNLKTVYNP